MSITTSCPGCKALFRLPDEMVGKLAQCQKCAGMFVVPASSAATTTPGISVPGESPPEPAPSPVDQANPAPPLPLFEVPSLEPANDADKFSSKKPPPPRHDYDPDDPAPKPRRREKPAKSNSGMIALLVVLIGGGLFTCVVCSGAMGYFIFSERKAAAVRPAMAMKVAVRNDDKDFFKDLPIDDFKVVNEFDKKPVDFGFKQADKKVDPFGKDFGKNVNPPINDIDALTRDGRNNFVQTEKMLPGGKKRFQGDVFKTAPPGGIPVTFNAAMKFRADDALNTLDPRNQGNKIHKQYAVQLQAGRTYQIDLIAGFDAYLYLINDANVIVAQDDDGGVRLNSRILFRANRTAQYRIQATSLGGASTGGYTLVVQQRADK